MRWICWATGLLGVCSLLSLAAGLDSAYGWDGSCSNCSQNYTYGAPACGAPLFGFTPGCCEFPPSLCDNIWDGYCQEKARRSAFWQRFGTGRTTSCGPASTSYQSITIGPRPSSQPTPTPVARPAEHPVGTIPADPMESPAGSPRDGPGEPPIPVIIMPAEAPLPPEPGDLEEGPEEGPIALPPESQPPDESTRRWSPSWLPRSNARDERANWPRLR